MGLFSKTKDNAVSDAPVDDDGPTLGDEPQKDELGRRSLNDHCAYLLDHIEPMAPFGMSLADAWGRTLCEDLKAYGDVPPVPVAEVDGYAIRYSDVAAIAPSARPVFALLGTPRRAAGGGDEPDDDDAASPSGQPSPPPTTVVGQSVRVLAGEEMPEGFDTVLAERQVSLDHSGRYITMLEKIAEGDWVRPAATEASDGEMLLAAGAELDDRHSALLAAVGFSRVMARPRTRVAAVQVIDSSADAPLDGGRAGGVGLHLINGAAQADGAAVYRLEVDLASPDVARDRLNDELIRADLVLTIGGVTDDYADPRLVEMLEQMGVVNVAEVAMRPGRRHGFGKIGDECTPVVMLPSDPTELLVAYHAFAHPVLRKLMGAEPFEHEKMLCFAEHDMDAVIGVTQLLPCRLRQDGNRYMASEITSRNHSWLTTLVAADALVIMPSNRQRVYAGEALPCWLLDDQRVASA